MLKAFKIIRVVVVAGSLLSAGLVRAQAIYATVTATVTDPNGHPLAAAQINAILVDPTGRQITSATSPNGQIVSSIVKPGVLDANGSFSIPLLETNTLSKPSGTQWQITISQPPLETQAYILTYQPPWTTSYTTAITGNVDLSSQLTALTAPIQFVNLKTGQNTLVSGASPYALTGAVSGGAPPNSAFNGSAPVTFDYHTVGAGAWRRATLGRGRTLSQEPQPFRTKPRARGARWSPMRTMWQQQWRRRAQ